MHIGSTGHLMAIALRQCWICGAPAQSREHRLKRSDLVRAYGKGPYTGPSVPLHVRNGKLTRIQGPGSDTVKYSHSLCQTCNSASTQPFDRAYDTFVSWVQAHESNVLLSRMINFQDVYGANFETGQRNLFKYFVKSFGCRLFDAGLAVPRDLVDLLPLEGFRTALKLSMCVNEDVLLFPKETRWRYIGKGELTGYASRSTPDSIQGYSWDENTSWLTICFWYAHPPVETFGAPWIADSQHVYLGSVSPLTPEARAGFVEKLRRRSQP